MCWKSKKDKVFAWGLCAIVLYVFISSFAYRFRHPEKTETELFLNLYEAVFWEK